MEEKAQTQTDALIESLPPRTFALSREPPRLCDCPLLSLAVRSPCLILLVFLCSLDPGWSQKVLVGTLVGGRNPRKCMFCGLHLHFPPFTLAYPQTCGCLGDILPPSPSLFVMGGPAGNCLRTTLGRIWYFTNGSFLSLTLFFSQVRL